MAIKGKSIPLSIDFEADIDTWVSSNPDVSKTDIIAFTADSGVLYIVYDDGVDQ